MVFIVDDSNALREQLAKMLSEIKGVKVIGQAQNAAQAIEGIRALKPKLVILDIQIPGGTGIEVLKTIKQYDHPMKVIILTNQPYFQYRKKCLALGADYFLDKTRDIDQLRQIIKDSFGRFEK